MSPIGGIESSDFIRRDRGMPAWIHLLGSTPCPSDIPILISSLGRDQFVGTRVFHRTPCRGKVGSLTGNGGEREVTVLEP